jgi:hypothetical protein
VHFRSAWIPALTQSLSKLSSNIVSELSVKDSSLLNQLCSSRYLYFACRYFSLFLRPLADRAGRAMKHRDLL